MQRYVALLRGIAPSGRNMTNDKLRGVLERLGFSQVSSVLSSGNVLFHSGERSVPALERRIEAGLASDLGLASTTIVRSLPDLQALLATDPFPGLVHGAGSYLTATFVKDAADAPPGVPATTDPRIRLVGYDPAARVVLAVTDTTAAGGTPDFMAWLERSYGKAITTRSWLTVQRIARRLAG